MKISGFVYPNSRENFFSGIQRTKQDLLNRKIALASKIVLALQRDVGDRWRKHALKTVHVDQAISIGLMLASTSANSSLVRAAS